MAPPSVMNLIRAIEKKPSDFGARNIAMICDALLPFVHNEGPNASERYHVEFTEPRGKLEYMFKFEYSLSTTAKEVINSLGIELNSFRLRQEVSLGIPEMKQFEADNEFYGGFTGRIGKANAFFYVPNGLELAVDNKIFSKGWYIDSKISLKHMTNGFYVFKYNDHLYLAHELFEEDIGKYNPINEIHHSYTEIIYLTGEGPYPYRVELAVDSDNVRIKNTSHDPLLVHLRKGESFTMDQIKKKINKEGLRG